MADRVLQRRDTSANWSSANPILAEGEIGIVTDTKGYKIGDGSTAWNDLEYPSNPTTVANELGDSTTTAISQNIVTHAILNKIDLSAIDFDAQTIAKLALATIPTRYNVIRSNKSVGIMEVFSDNIGHMVTEVFDTHYIVENGALTGEHSDDKAFRYMRSYHLVAGGTSDIPVGTWGEWKQVYSSDNQKDFDALKTGVNNLYANTGIDEYETFSDQKAYSAGTTVLYNGLLYTFTTDHVAGAWDESQVESASLNKMIQELDLSKLFNSTIVSNNGERKVVNLLIDLKQGASLIFTVNDLKYSGGGISISLHGYENSEDRLLSVFYSNGIAKVDNTYTSDLKNLYLDITPNPNPDTSTKSYSLSYSVITDYLYTIYKDSLLFKSIFFDNKTNYPLNSVFIEGCVARFLDKSNIPQLKAFYKSHLPQPAEGIIGLKKNLHFAGTDTTDNIIKTFDGIRLYSGETFKYIVKNVSYEEHNFSINLYGTSINQNGEVQNVLIKDLYDNGEAELIVPNGITYISLYVELAPNGAKNFSADAFLLTQEDLLDFTTYNEYNVNLENNDFSTTYSFTEAINSIPTTLRTKGIKVTYLDDNNNWRTYKYIGSMYNSIYHWAELGLNKYVHYSGTNSNSEYNILVNIKKGQKFVYVVKNNTYAGDGISINIYNAISSKLLKAIYGNGIYEITASEDISVLKISCGVNSSGGTEEYSGDAYILYGTDLWLKEYFDELNTPKVWMPDNVYMLNGTKLQIFKCSVALTRNPDNYDLHITGDGTLGYNRNNYYEYDVNSRDSDFTLTFGVKNEHGTFNCNHPTKFIHVNKGISPLENKNILVIGDSFTDQQYWVAELRRLLTGVVTNNYSDTAESSIISDRLSNITFIGTQDTDKTPNEGYSGKHYAFFATNGSNYGGVNPFWNSSMNEGHGGIDFTWYCQQHSYSKIDYAIILLGTNGYNEDKYVNAVWDALLAHNSNIKVIIMGRAFANPWSAGVSGLGNKQEYISSSDIFSVNEFFQKKCQSDNYKNNFLFVDYNTQMDVFNNYHYEEMAANQRNSDVLIRNSKNTNDNLHPGKYAYWQIADAVRPAFHYWCLRSNE